MIGNNDDCWCCKENARLDETARELAERNGQLLDELAALSELSESDAKLLRAYAALTAPEKSPPQQPPSVALCMPVGPAGVQAPTAQLRADYKIVDDFLKARQERTQMIDYVADYYELKRTVEELTARNDQLIEELAARNEQPEKPRCMPVGPAEKSPPLSVALCMPVGPAGVQAPTAQLLCAIAASGLASRIILCAGHLIRARNTALLSALEHGAERIIWLDSDVSTGLDDLRGFLARSEDEFARQPIIGWISALYRRRGETRKLNFCYARQPRQILWAGLGLQYWHIARYRAAGSPEFRWVEPLGEDYRMCDDLAFGGVLGLIDDLVPTVHDGAAYAPPKTSSETIQ